MISPTTSRDGLIDGPYAWFRLAVTLLLGTISSVGMWSVVVILPLVQEEMNVDRGDVSLAFAATMIGFAGGNALLGRYVDRYGVVPPLLAAIAALAGGLILASFAASIWQLALIQGVLVGVGTAAGFGPLIADISHWFERRRGLAVAIAACGNYAGGALWPLVLQGLIEAEGWRSSYVLIGFFCLLSMVPLALLLRRGLPVRLADAAGTAAGAVSGLLPVDLTARQLQALILLAGVACCVAMSMPQVHIVAYCVDLGYGVARGAEMLSIMLAGGVLSRILFGYLADHFGGVRTLLAGSVLQGVSLFLYIPFDGLASLYVVSLVFGLAQGGIVPCYAVIVREYLPASDAAKWVGMAMMSTIIGMALGGWLSGWIFDLSGSYQAAFINGIGWNLLNIAVMLFILWRTRRPLAAAA
jgi:MFS family permease